MERYPFMPYELPYTHDELDQYYYPNLRDSLVRRLMKRKYYISQRLDCIIKTINRLITSWYHLIHIEIHLSFQKKQNAKKQCNCIMIKNCKINI
ncbi:unnamed protein product [Schistosoma haematobium]|nr:unnamed protein product [Schistosoma haematobium]